MFGSPDLHFSLLDYVQKQCDLQIVWIGSCGTYHTSGTIGLNLLLLQNQMRTTPTRSHSPKHPEYGFSDSGPPSDQPTPDQSPTHKFTYYQSSANESSQNRLDYTDDPATNDSADIWVDRTHYPPPNNSHDLGLNPDQIDNYFFSIIIRRSFCHSHSASRLSRIHSMQSVVFPHFSWYLLHTDFTWRSDWVVDRIHLAIDCGCCCTWHWGFDVSWLIE